MLHRCCRFLLLFSSLKFPVLAQLAAVPWVPMKVSSDCIVNKLVYLRDLQPTYFGMKKSIHYLYSY